MAEESASDDAQLTFNIKSSNDAKYVMTLPANTTVGDLKTKLSAAEYAAIPEARQRLIYSGRVLKDAETLASYKIKDGNTVHLVKGADSNARQNPADQGGAAAGSNPANPAAHVPQNFAAGTGANNLLAGLTGARFAGYGQLPGSEMFGADGGMGAPPNADQMVSMLEDPNFAQQMGEMMQNPAFLEQMRSSPMLRNNPMAQAALNDPNVRRLMFNPQFLRAQIDLQRRMGGGAGAGAFPAPGATDTTPSNAPQGNTQQDQNAAAANPFAAFGGANPSGANPFAALFGGNPGAAEGTTPTAATPSAGSAGQNTPSQTAGAAAGAGLPDLSRLAGLMNPQGGTGGSNPLAEMMQAMQQNPEAMRSMMNMMGGMGGQGAGAGTDAAGAGGAGFNPFLYGGLGGGLGQAQPPQDTRPPEEVYADQLRQLNEMGFYDFDRNIRALRMSGGSVQGAVEVLFSGSL